MADKIDDYVTGAVRGAPKPAPAPEKPIWEKMGMTKEEYALSLEQRAQDDRKRIAQEMTGQGKY